MGALLLEVGTIWALELLIEPTWAHSCEKFALSGRCSSLSSSCTEWAAGRWSGGSCIDGAAGLWLLGSFIVCAAGKWRSSLASSCTDCAAGKWGAGEVRADECASLAAGMCGAQLGQVFVLKRLG